MRRYGYRIVFGAGALLLGGPTLALLASHSVAAIVAVSIARGIGFGLNTVVIGTMMTLIWVATPVAMLAGLCLFGIGFGISENATFAVMIDRAPRSGYGTASALWSLAYDGGYGAGPAMFGMFVIYTGYPAAFAITGMLMIAALIPAMRDRAASPR